VPLYLTVHGADCRSEMNQKKIFQKFHGYHDCLAIVACIGGNDNDLLSCTPCTSYDEAAINYIEYNQGYMLRFDSQARNNFRETTVTPTSLLRSITSLLILWLSCKQFQYTARYTVHFYIITMSLMMSQLTWCIK